MLHGKKRGFADVIKITKQLTLKWEIILGYLGGRKIHERRQEESRRGRKSDSKHEDLMWHCCFEARSGWRGPMRRNVSGFKELRSVAPADSPPTEAENFGLRILEVVSPKYYTFKSANFLDKQCFSVVFKILIYLGFENRHLLTCLKSICVYMCMYLYLSIYFPPN